MRFKQFLEDHDRQKPLDELLQHYKKNIGILAQRDIALFRGMNINPALMAHDTEHDIYYGEFYPREARDSKTGHNFLLNLSKEWGAPDRSKSVFATRKIDGVAEVHGDVYVVVPRDDVKLYAYTPADMNVSSHSEERTEAIGLLQHVYGMLNDIRKISTSVSNGTAEQSNLVDWTNEFIKQFDVDSIFRRGQFFTRMNMKMDHATMMRAFAMFDKMAADEHYQKLISNILNKPAAMDGVLDLYSGARAAKADFKKHGIEKFSELGKAISAEKYEVTIHKSLADVPFGPKLDDELWFEGAFLILDAGMKDVAGKNLTKLL